MKATLAWMAAVTVAVSAGAGRAEDAAPVASGSASIVISTGTAPASGVTESLRREARAALGRAATWMRAQQQKGGHWSNADYPALTAFPVWALTLAGEGASDEVRKGVACLLTYVQPNGSIYRPVTEKGQGGLSTYNTAICMVALHLAGGTNVVPVVQKARGFVVQGQHLGGDQYKGGMGYDAESGRPYADLSNSYIAYEAMRVTEAVEDLRKTGEARVDLNWKEAQGFVQRTQNDARFNAQPWATDDAQDRGGFAYHPDQTRAGTVTNAAGVVKFRSMRGMTYAGLLSYIYADVDRTDPRVEATVNWIVRNWSVDANNPTGGGGEGKALTQDDREGLFYLYNVMAKGLAAYGRDALPVPEGGTIQWRKLLIEKLLALQKIDPATGAGYWVNDVGRYWESDPVLVTSYAMIALQIALGK